MTQIALPLVWPERERDEDFVVAPANAAAVRHLGHWALWPVPITLMTGPRKSGRSLLARLFAEKTGGRVLDDAWAVGEEALFHAWNGAMASRRPLLVVADEGWAPVLPDLASRLAATPHVAIALPDDDLIRALVERGLGRRGLAAPPRLMEWLLRRIERSYVAVGDAIDALDRAALAGQRRLTTALAREALRGVPAAAAAAGPGDRAGVIDA